MELDKTDKLILRFLSSGIYSYKELADRCNVTRNTIYRRITTLERAGIIKSIVSCSIDYSKLRIKPICINAYVPWHRQEEVINSLRAKQEVKMVWKCFAHQINMVMVAFCSEDEEGKLIESLSNMLEKFDSKTINVIVGFIWEKQDMSLFCEEVNEKRKTEF
jgi:DNA-binding Lrp family transcriptional regulator